MKTDANWLSSRKKENSSYYATYMHICQRSQFFWKSPKNLVTKRVSQSPRMRISPTNMANPSIGSCHDFCTEYMRKTHKYSASVKIPAAVHVNPPSPYTSWITVRRTRTFQEWRQAEQWKQGVRLLFTAMWMYLSLWVIWAALSICYPCRRSGNTETAK